VAVEDIIDLFVGIQDPGLVPLGERQDNGSEGSLHFGRLAAKVDAPPGRFPPLLVALSAVLASRDRRSELARTLTLHVLPVTRLTRVKEERL